MACYFSALLLCLRASRGAEPLEAGIHYPVDTRWNNAYSQIEDLLKNQDWDRLVDALLLAANPAKVPVQPAEKTDQTGGGHHGGLPEPPDSSSPSLGFHEGVPQRPSTTVAAGAGFALGPGPAIERMVKRLPEEARRRFDEILESQLSAQWAAVRSSGSTASRQFFRHQVFRDFPWSAMALELAREELDGGLESGDLDQVERAGAFLLESPKVPAGGKLHAAWLLLQAGRVAGGDTAIQSLLERFLPAFNPESYPQDRNSPRNPPEGTAIAGLTEAELRLKKDLEEGLRQAPPSTRPGSAPVLNALLVRERGPAAGEEPFELGSVQLRRPFELNELRLYVDEGYPLKPPMVPPAQAPDGSRNEPPGTARNSENTGKPEKSEPPVSLDPKTAAGLVLEERPAAARSPGDLALPFFPAAQGHRVILQTYREVVAYALPTLELLWSAPLEEGSFEALGSLRSPAIGVGQVLAASGDLLTALDLATGQTLWQKGVVYERASRKLLFQPFETYLLSRHPPPAAEAAAEGAETPIPDPMAKPAGARKDGKKEEAAAPFLASTLTPPVNCLKNYLVGITVKVEREILTYLAAFNQQGEPQWITYLGSIHTSDYLGMGSTLSPPLVHQQRAYMLTNLGFVAAVDALDGQILWLQAYPRLDERGKAQAIRDRNRWQPNPLVPYRGSLLAAPQDADLLLCLDQATGALLWRIPREAHTTLLGTDGERCLLSGTAVTALSLAGKNLGSVAWRWQPPGRGILSLGRALLTASTVLVSDLHALYTLDPQNGQAKAGSLWDWRGGGGNLMLLPTGQLAVASTGGFLVYNQRERERARVAELPAQTEVQLLETAKLELKSGQIEDGLQTLQQWRNSRFPEPLRNSPTDRLLFEIAEALRYSVDLQGEDGPQAAAMLGLLIKAERLPQAKAVAAFRAAQAHLKRGEFKRTMEVVKEALELGLGEVPCSVFSPLDPHEGARNSPLDPAKGSRNTPLGPSPELNNEFLEVPGRVIAEGIIQEVQGRGPAGEAAFTEFEWAAQEELASARRQGTQIAFLKVIRNFPLTQAGGIAQIELANYFSNQQNLTEAIGWFLNYLRTFPRSEDYVSVALQAADLLTKMGRYPEARDLLLGLARDHADAPVGAGKQQGLGGTVQSYVERRLREPGFREIELPIEGRWLRFPLRLRWRSPANLLTVNRSFLQPSGAPPEALKGCFLTQSLDLIECRQLDTGLPLWTVQFAMVPAFKTQKSLYVSRYAPSAQYWGNLLLFYDSTNLLAIDTEKGIARWHVSFEDQDRKPAATSRPDQTGPPKIRSAPVLQERIQGVASWKDAVFAIGSTNKLHRYDREGLRQWVKPLPFEVSRFSHGPFAAQDRLIIVRRAPVEVAFLDPESGQEKEALKIQEGADARLIQAPLLLKNDVFPPQSPREDVMLLLLPNELVAVDLKKKEIRSRYQDRKKIFQQAWPFPAYPDQVLLACRQDRRAALTGISLSQGEELWRYDQFPADRSGNLSVFPDESRLYVIYGAESLSLMALEVRPGPEGDRFAAMRIWPNEPNENRLGTFFPEGTRELLIAPDAIIHPVPASNSLSVFNKFNGVPHDLLVEPIHRFLQDKKRFQCQVQEGLFIFLTDRGDAAFESNVNRLNLQAEGEKIERLRRYLANPYDWDNVIWLSLNFFREKNIEAGEQILNTSLLSERLPSLDHPGKYQLLKFLLDGIKEEAMKDSQPQIICRKLRAPPLVDGELNESWNCSHKVPLRDLLCVNNIPAPGQEMDIWKGEEDLSATLYTGWDERYFYFALDVEDNRIFPYEKEATVWKGDCLIIGLDPTGDGGLYQRADDQLLTLALTVPNRKPKKSDDGKEGEDEDEEARKPEGLYAVKKKEDNSGVIYEVGLPWSSFHFEGRGESPPMPGKRFGLSLIITDDDTGQGASKMLSLNPCHLLPREQAQRFIWKHLIPEYFPKVILE
ncbi:MAG: PQQ-binding-like beta-propeller repeat protein [Planctomycetes bacterium]|nr:PQQ-binding-like beta-propeller repeat protein [Planctomycetota bacterium]